VHREIANGAALFFDRFSPSELAEKVAQLLESPASQSALRESGLRQSETFSWSAHVDRLLELAQELADQSH
jgi:glycosyltransferase involved in cell wall biosynthesis